MRQQKYHLLLLLVVLFGSQSCGQNDSGLLFDGTSFAGWEGPTEFFRIEDQAIVAGSLTQSIPKNQFMCTEESFSDFDMSLQVKFIDPTRKNNGGIQLRSQRIPDHHEVIGYQADVGYTSDGLVWCGLYDESRRRKFLVTPSEKVAEVVNLDDWNDYRIRCEGNHIQFWLNGSKVLDYREEEDSISQTGVICVQIHGGNPAEAWYRDIRLKNIP